MEVSFTSVYCDFPSPYTSKVPFRAPFLGVIWIQEVANGLSKDMGRAKFSSNFTDLAVSFFADMSVSESFFSSREVVSRSLKAKKMSKYRVLFFFFVNDF